LIGGEGEGLEGSSWLLNREVGETVGEFTFGPTDNPFRGNELLLPKNWNQLSQQINSDDEGIVMSSCVRSDTSILEDKLISALDVSKRSKNCLRKTGIVTIEQLVKYSRTDLIKINGIDKRTVEEIVDALKNHGLSLQGN
jgi:hypothetical protein